MYTMSETPLFSVIIPTYNREDMVLRAVQSIIAQEFQDWEVMVIDDGSQDNTMEAIQKLHDKRIRYLYIPHSERSIARNRGVKESQGRYCCFLDSDDYYLPNHLAILAEALTDGGDKVFKVQFSREGEDGVLREYPALGTRNAVDFIWNEFPGLMSFAFPREALLKHQFPERFSVWEDRHFLLRIALEHEILDLPHMTAVFTDHDQRSVNRINKLSFDKRLRELVGAVEDLFSRHGKQLEQYIPKKLMRRKMAQMLIGMAIDAKEAGMKEEALDALREARPYLDRRTLPRWLQVAGGALRAKI